MSNTIHGEFRENDVIILQPGHAYALDVPGLMARIQFQDGPVKEAGINGWQNEELISVLINRLKFLNTVMYSKHNDEAIDALMDALYALRERTRKRIKAGVEGTSEPMPEESKPYASGDQGEHPKKTHMPDDKRETD